MTKENKINDWLISIDKDEHPLRVVTSPASLKSIYAYVPELMDEIGMPVKERLGALVERFKMMKHPDYQDAIEEYLVTNKGKDSLSFLPEGVDCAQVMELVDRASRILIGQKTVALFASLTPAEMFDCYEMVVDLREFFDDIDDTPRYRGPIA